MCNCQPTTTALSDAASLTKNKAVIFGAVGLALVAGVLAARGLISKAKK